jgi:hypothetical protein
MVFRARLNSSCDAKLHADERVYPEDSSPFRAREVRLCTEQQLEELLWRQGDVPEWVDLSVIGVTEVATLIEARCCGRFTANEAFLYHQLEGRPPFHVLGPTLPIGYEDGQRFSIYNRSECWGPTDIARLRGHAHKVWSLELVGDASRDRELHNLPELARLEVLEVKDGEVSDDGLHALSRCPRLRVLRVGLSRPSSFHLRDFPNLPQLTTLSIENVMSTRWDLTPLFRACPTLTELALVATGELLLAGALPEAMDSITITAERLLGEVELPRRVKHLSLHLRHAADAEVERLLESVETAFLSLRGTPVGDSALQRIAARSGLLFLDVVDTRVSEDQIRSLASSKPALRLYPNLPGTPRT